MPISQEQMDLVRSALAARTAGGAVGGGNPAPAITQATPAMPGTPTLPQGDIMAPSAAEVPTTPMAPASGGSPAAGVAKKTMAAQGPNFDDETRLLAKALTKKMLEIL